MSSDDTVAMIPTFFNPGAIPISENTRAAWTKNKCPANRSIPGFFLFHAPLSSFNFKRCFLDGGVRQFVRARHVPDGGGRGHSSRGQRVPPLRVSNTKKGREAPSFTFRTDPPADENWPQFSAIPDNSWAVAASLSLSPSLWTNKWGGGWGGGGTDK